MLNLNTSEFNMVMFIANNIQPNTAECSVVCTDELGISVNFHPP